MAVNTIDSSSSAEMSTRDQLESTVADSHFRLQLSESAIHSDHHTQSGEHLNCFNVIFHCDCFDNMRWHWTQLELFDQYV